MNLLGILGLGKKAEIKSKKEIEMPDDFSDKTRRLERLDIIFDKARLGLLYESQKKFAGYAILYRVYRGKKAE